MASITKPLQTVAAIALIRDEQGRILIQKRKLTYLPETFDKWEFPGGGVEFGETPEQAVQREVQEEIGCEVEVLRMLPRVVSNFWKREDGVKVQALVLCFECQIVSGIPTASHWEVGEIRWCTKEELSTLDLLPGNQTFVEAVA